jgi:hypothetical protein
MAKPLNSRLAIVTASLDPQAAGLITCLVSWRTHSTYELPLYVVVSWLTQEPPGPVPAQGTMQVIHRAGGGVVPAFAEGVARAFADGAEAVCCFHDDLRIDQDGWDVVVQDALDSGVQFAGFGGAQGLGHGDLYKVPYRPMQLARQGFLSNMQDAEAHGQRVLVPTPAVVFDGFSQIGTRDWFAAAWAWLAASGVQHHFYDGMLGCLAARAGVQPGRLLPVRCHHFGGRTAVGNPDYILWAQGQTPGGDQGFWEHAHWVGYTAFKDVLPLRLEKAR